MIQPAPTRTLLEELESRHDEVLDQLDVLNSRIESALREAGHGPSPALAERAAGEAVPVKAPASPGRLRGIFGDKS